MVAAMADAPGGTALIRAYAALAAGRALEPFEYEPPALGPHDVHVSVECCGVSLTDVENVDNLFGRGVYPMVPGHEVIGEVQAAGAGAAALVGQRVGVGWQARSCMACAHCHAGDEHHCARQEATCWKNHGGFSEAIRVDRRFAFEIPAGLPSEGAAPLMCAGLTVWSPFHEGHVRPSMRVGVVGIGGLGHLAIAFARAFGCEVTAISRSPRKEADARDLGAHRFLLAETGALAAAAGSLDFALATAGANLDWGAYLGLLAPRGRLHVVGVFPGEMRIPGGALRSGERTVSASNIGSRAAARAMLVFAAEHGILARTEVLPMASVNEAMGRVRRGQARYRIVLRNR
jgi:uncharacterized zinc-type alcohol dehydrogenase-like protein